MTYKFRVSLPGIKGFARIYEVNEKNTLYSFHKQMLYDMDFPQDQIVLFKAFDADGNIVARYATINLGDGSIDTVFAGKAVKDGIVKFEYFYDTTNKRSVIITLEAVLEQGNTLKPTLLENESKGPNPEAFLNGYVAFEDLPVEKQRRLAADPDDEDFDDEDEDSDLEDDEDDDDEDFKETYSEDEE